MKLSTELTHREHGRTLFFLLCFFLLSKYHLYIGFALKPYMIFLCVFLLFHLSAFSFQKMYAFELVLLCFYAFYGFTGAFSLYPLASLRLMLGIILLVGCYLIVKFILSTCSIQAIQAAIARAGLLFNAVSLLLYTVGLKSVGFHGEEMAASYGVLLDRGYPRLIGLLEDPNLYVFYNTLFFAYFLTHMKSWSHKAGFALCLLTTILTFSRGGILAMLLMILLYMAISHSVKSWRLLLAMGVTLSVISYLAAAAMKIPIGKLLESRMEDFSSDGGSGRFELWGRAWEYFLDHPVMGIGADNFIEYNTAYYGKSLYTHNTLLQILSESGFLGFSLYAAFLLLVFKQLLSRCLAKKHLYLLLTFMAFLLQMLSLSLIINELFLLYLAIVSVILQKEKTSRLSGKEKLANHPLVTKGVPAQ
ncbi:O-antigen ligase family protein [Pseudobacillus badius]|uniref:O-antigen ligase family protein n=1 Tax=Bacillus badius TaxID=1455 RepID=UPI001CBD9DBB|nr:O-antigen ligase family protein [Bacillus badius]MED0667984.1 O-antigen ligase family protein [Bacillus badius]UAT33020.1 O-antigen ligase family protein [Bacillus badius]